MDPFSLIGNLAGKVSGTIGHTLAQFIPSSTYNFNDQKPAKPTNIVGNSSQMKLSYGSPQPGLVNQMQGAAPTPSPSPLAIQMTQNGYGRNPDVSKYNISPEVHHAIQVAAHTFGLAPHLLYDIAASEGGFRPDAKNTTPEGQKVGIPTGLFQFTPGSWKDVLNYAAMPNSSLHLPANADRNDPYINALAAAYLIKFGQLGRWDASKPNWGRFYSQEELNPYYVQTPGYQQSLAGR